MKIKSYYAASVEAAITQARHELGPEAMILQSRKAPPEAQHLGDYEVVFAATAPAEIAAAEMLESPAGEDRMERQFADLRRQLDVMRRTIERSGMVTPRWLAPSSPLAEWYSRLIAAEVPPELVQEIVHAVSSANGGPESVAGAIAGEMERRITVDSTLGRGDARPRIAALVGPAGVGKTSCLVKLAVNGLSARRPVQILSMDTFRVAACEQLRTYAAILGAGFRVLETPAALAQSIEECRGKDLVLIDTPGFGFADMEDAADLARFFATRPDIDVHLTLSASMKPADLLRVVDAFEIFRPAKLLFTRLDETQSFGPLFGQAVRTEKPVSFLASGQRIPDDLQSATRARLIALVLGEASQRVRRAA